MRASCYLNPVNELGEVDNQIHASNGRVGGLRESEMHLSFKTSRLTMHQHPQSGFDFQASAFQFPADFRLSRAQSSPHHQTK